MLPSIKLSRLGCILLILGGFLFSGLQAAHALPPGCRTHPAGGPPVIECCWQEKGYKVQGGKAWTGEEMEKQWCHTGPETNGLVCYCNQFKGGTPSPGSTKTTNSKTKAPDPIIFKPSVTIPGTDFASGKDVKIEGDTKAIAKYVIAIVKYSTGAIAVLAVIVLMAAGLMWVSSAGNQESIGKARKLIAGALGGLALSFLSFLVLSMVNTSLVAFKTDPITKLEVETIPQVCALTTDASGGTKASNMPQERCDRMKQRDVPSLYAKVECKPFSEGGWQATADKTGCQQTNGCCAVSVGRQIFFYVSHTYANQFCLEGRQEAECNDRQTTVWKHIIPIFTEKDFETHFKFGVSCQNFDKCAGKKICQDEDECRSNEGPI